ncbi:MAG: PAS domain S-box protein [Burkholderiales bacterium]|nr:PAS domain S-box protein [Burkholderiales bacterium]
MKESVNSESITEHARKASPNPISFADLFEAVVEAMILVDASGKIVMANATAQELCGYTLNELCKLEVEALIPQRFREHHREYRKHYLAHPRKRPMGNNRNLVLLHRDGHEIGVDISLSPVTLQHQIYVLLALNTVDRCSQAEYALHESQERLWLIKQMVNVGIFDIDCVNRRIYCDERLRELCGNSIDEMDDLIAVVHTDDRARCQAAYDKAINPRMGGEFRVQFRIVQNSDLQSDQQQERWLTIFGETQFEMGKAKRIVGIARDVTQRKQREKKLQQYRNETEALFKQQVAMLTASAIAHELNSPLTAISAYSEVALHALNETPTDCGSMKNAIKSCFEQAQLAGHKLYELLNFLQNNTVESEVLDLNQVIEDALLLARGDGYGDFILVLDLESKLPAVRANRFQIQRVLVNLIRNAVEAMRSARVSVSEIRISVTTLALEKMAMVSIIDNGPGIDPETLKRIFKPFFTTKPTGLGVGLSISRALIEANGGRLWMDPDYKQGARFHFTLPFA